MIGKYLEGFCDFWKFSLETYANSSMREALLNLQERWEVDVNMLLFALWRAKNGLKISAQECSAVAACVAQWRDDVVRPAREVRRRIKDQCGDVSNCYEQAKKLELASEREQQWRMYKGAERLAPGAATPAPAQDIAEANLLAYVECIGENVPAEAIKILAKGVQELTK